MVTRFCPSNYSWKGSLSVSLSVLLIILTAVHPIDFTLGVCIAEDPKKRSVECEAVWMSSSQESCKQQYWRPSNQPVPNRHVLNGHCTSICKTHQYSLLKSFLVVTALSPLCPAVTADMSVLT